jgi:hypothetical protein
MAPRSSSERSPISVMRWNDDLSSSSEDSHPTKELPLIKSVRFSDDSSIREITHLDDMPEEDVTATWYTSKEYSEIKSSYQMTIFMMEAGETLNDAEHTSRGLEYRTQEGAWARYENKRDAYNAVLDEQDRQWKVDKDDDMKIRQIYLKHSTKCADAAVVRALQDEKEAREYQKESVKPKLKKKKKVVSKKNGEKSEKTKSTKKKTSSTSPEKSKSSSTTKKSATTSTEKERKITRSASEYTTASSSSEMSLRRNSSIVLGERSSTLIRDRVSFV